MDQITATGHHQRLEDLNRFAELGIEVLRFPALWEKHSVKAINWAWTDERLHHLRALGIRPIIGFIHHGSGPLDAGLLAPNLSAALADFARTFAQRYPWIDGYTPINEPLTTARFSGLYGLWHPFGRSLECFARVFVNQCNAIRAAMRAIHEINPHAQLVQTEDLGKTFSTGTLQYQADLENERRWLTYDLLCGRLRPGQPMRQYLTAGKIDIREIDSFESDPCVPDILGVNYYVTSERFLDEDLSLYPPQTHGGNEREAYADLPAARARVEGLQGPSGLMKELWSRYGLPIAVTEVQLACTREEQLRWLLEVWNATRSLQRERVDVRGFTAWSLLGAYDWDTLLTESRGFYESGAFDVRSSPPRATAVARAVKSLAGGNPFAHPVLANGGWWRRALRFGPSLLAQRDEEETLSGQPLLILGSNGVLGNAIARICITRGLRTICANRESLDITDGAAIARLVAEKFPWAIVNAAGFSDAEAAEKDPHRSFCSNVLGPTYLAEVCAEYNLPFLSFSSDLVFDGTKGSAYHEKDAPHPLNQYGHSKKEAEERILRYCPHALIIRTGPLFSPWEERGFVTDAYEHLENNREILVYDAIVSPTYVPDLVNVALDLLMDGECGCWHLANQGQVSWAHWAKRIAESAGLDIPAFNVIPQSRREMIRPAFSALTSRRGVLMPSFDSALERFFALRCRSLIQTIR